MSNNYGKEFLVDEYRTRQEVSESDFLASSFYIRYPNSPLLSVPDGRFPSPGIEH